MPRLRVGGLEAGLSLCVYVDLADDRDLARELKEDGVRCEAPSYYQQRSKLQTGLVIDMAATGDRELDLVIARLSP